jgi:hypothetical protein
MGVFMGFHPPKTHLVDVRAVRLGDDGGATRARAAVSFSRVGSFGARAVPGARLCNRGRVAQWESACFTRKRSQVQNLPRPPRSRSGRPTEFRLVHFAHTVSSNNARASWVAEPRSSFAYTGLRLVVVRRLIQLRGDLDVVGGGWRPPLLALRTPFVERKIARLPPCGRVRGTLGWDEPVSTRPDVLGRTTAGITPVVRLARQAGVPAFSVVRTTLVFYAGTSFIA